MRNTRHLFKLTLILVIGLLLFASAATAADSKAGNVKVSCNAGITYKRIKENTLLYNGTEYSLDDEARIKIEKEHPLLIERILSTRSMDNDERQYWLDILPAMDDVQVARLHEILEVECKKLGTLGKNYQQDIGDINRRHLEEWERLKAQEEERERQAKPAGGRSSGAGGQK